MSEESDCRENPCALPYLFDYSSEEGAYLLTDTGDPITTESLEILTT